MFKRAPQDGIINPSPKKDLGPLLLFFVVLFIIIFIKSISIRSFSQETLYFAFYSLIIVTYILSRFILSFFHKTIDVDDSYEPTVTFVVPAYNEADNVAETIRRFGQVTYPREKIEVIAVNDGSTDQTFKEMQKVKKELKHTLEIKIVNWHKNRGKRAGMAEGIKKAKHEIIIFIDSDSFLEEKSVHHLVKYFSNPKVGAVSGHTDVHNINTNVLTQMQAMRYFLAFKIYKAAESFFGNVTCCPGCCSAYKREYLMEFVDEWLNQKFLGVTCTFGDDRSLTNYTIRNHVAVYSEKATAYTVVPDNFKKYMRQQQRWKKSWVRETLIASLFMWRKNPIAALSFYLYIFLAFSAPIVFMRAIIFTPIHTGRLPYIYLGGLFLMLFLHGLYYRVETGKKAWLKPVFSFWFNTVILMWQLPWAVVTMRDTRWGTR